MLFNSVEFLCLFLPVTFLVFYLFGGLKLVKAAQIWLIIASFFFYGWKNPHYLPLLCLSVIINYLIAFKVKENKILYLVGLMFNIGLLIYFKYSIFILENLKFLIRLPVHANGINFQLPLGLSFFTFTQLAFLTDKFTGTSEKSSFLEYTLFITTFPHLMAGPIVYAEQLIPQFRINNFLKFSMQNFTVGLSFISIGLFQKVFIADPLGKVMNPVFQIADASHFVSTVDAWIAAFGYTLQLYFDFSGYSLIAVGLGLIFNISLPINFLSPYKSKNIGEFWRRWHISLSDFLRTYLFNPLVMTMGRRGNPRLYLNLVITMTIAGLWHGASWNFIFWGFLHGIFLVIHRLWESLSTKYSYVKKIRRIHGPLSTWAPALTVVTVAVSFLFFRARTWGSAWKLFFSLFGSHETISAIDDKHIVILSLVLLWAFVLIVPNTASFFQNYLSESMCGDKRLLEKTHFRAMTCSDLKPGPSYDRLTIATLFNLLGIGCVILHLVKSGGFPFIYFDF
jgi:alginate O-acetyltransferase complex protein AlgI